MRLGTDGVNVTIASKEEILEGIFDDVECDDYFSTKSHHAIHGTTVMDYIRQVLPDARKIACDLSSRTTAKEGWVCPGIEKLLADPPQVFTGSRFSSLDHTESHMVKYKALLDKGCFMVFGAGNMDEEGCLNVVKNDVFKAIAAYKLVKGKLKKEYFSSVGEEVDFASLDNLRATWDNKKHTGTSFSAPLFASMVGLVQDFFICNTGKQLPYDKLLEFVKDNCVDIEEEGRDNKTGYGLFILPDPETIDIKKYMEDYVEMKEKRIVLKIGSNIAVVDGEEKKLDAAPIIKNDRTMVPIRFIAEELGYNVEWDALTREVIIEK